VKKTDILKKLRSSGLRPTKQRVEIAKFLFERDKTFHFTVESLDKLLAKKTASRFALATYFDTNVSNHHHFYDSETSELIDINANEIVIQKIPKAPNGKKIKNVEVFINLKN
jgi:Fur family iron response transcriptional regulator